MRENLDVAGQNLALCLRDVKNLTDLVRKNMSLANEKDRSVGVLSQQLAESCQTASQLQMPSVQSALLGFATILSRIELHRQALYQRIRILSESALLVPAKNTSVVATTLQKRNQAIKRAQRLPPAETDPNAAKNNLIRVEAGSLNNQTMQQARDWCLQYNGDLKRVVREYAHAQMEFAAKALEQWSVFMEDMTLLDFSSDTDQMVTMLEEGGALQMAAV